MSRPEPTEVRRVACIGGGTIGSGWAAQFLRMGMEVVGWDPAPDGEERLRRQVDAAWPALERLGLAPGASPNRLSYAPSLEAAVAEVAFVQESAPEEMAAKIDTVTRIDAAAPASVVIASSTSGLSMSDIQVQCVHPGRTVVGHPFNPVCLVPLVEVVPGEKSDPDVVQWTQAFYRHAGKSAVICQDRVYGFLANRLQIAMWREALHMLVTGEATVEALDRCISEGPGLRWAIMGPFLTFHLGGGEGGMNHFLDRMQAEWDAPYCRMDGPALTDELRQAVVEGCEQLAGGQSIDELARMRDDCLIEIQGVLAEHRDGISGLTRGGGGTGN